jgi:predicted adenine nucleotide alpha hydrolase (AANH) superfamily ATPase
MKLLLHTCCGPCLLYPLNSLRQQGIEPVGYFFNPNIHPLLEFERRVEALETVCQKMGVEMVWDSRLYGLEVWLRGLEGRFSQQERCPVCYRTRLEAAARTAAALGFSAFSTTLLYSKYQRHELIRQMGEEVAGAYGLDFFYQDFRIGWSQGIEEAKAIGIYRQPYCGCIFSEAERYKGRKKRMEKRLLAGANSFLDAKATDIAVN